MAADNPFAKYAQPAASDNPFAKYAAEQGASPAKAISVAAKAAAAASPEPKGKLWNETIRPLITPTVEMLGAGGGAFLGGTGGSVVPGPGTIGGTLLGGGLGYAGAKELLQLGDVVFGNKAPREGVANITEPLGNIAEGATWQGAGLATGAVAGPILDKLGNVVRPLTGQGRASRIAQQASAQDAAAIRNALTQARGQNVTAGQATAGINNPAWQALSSRALERDPRFLRALTESQDDVTRNILASKAGGSTAADVQAAAIEGRKAVNAMTSPIRQNALSRANEVGGKVAQLEKAADDLGGVGSKVLKDAIRETGIKPLRPESLAPKLDEILKNPAFAADDVIEGSVREIRSQMGKWVSQDGLLDATALDAIRKNAVNAVIAKQRPGLDATSQRNLASRVLGEVKPAIDDAIEQAGGQGYKTYLKIHSTEMQKLAEKRLVGEGLRLWKTNKDEFVRLVQNESPEVVEKILGPGRYNIATELADDTIMMMRDQAAKAVRDASVKAQSKEGAEVLQELLAQNLPKVRIPSMLNVYTLTANRALSHLENKLGKSTLEALTTAMKTPEGASNLLNGLPPPERARVLKLITDPAAWQGFNAKNAIPAAGVAVKNALTPTESQNALASEK